MGGVWLDTVANEEQGRDIAITTFLTWRIPCHLLFGRCKSSGIHVNGCTTSNAW